MPTIHVASEIGTLGAVLVHTPGREIQAVTPGTRDHYLYDDIIDMTLARREHDALTAALARFASVYQVRQLLSEVLAREDVRRFFIQHVAPRVSSDVLVQHLADLPVDGLVTMLIEGAVEEGGPIAHALNAPGHSLPPAPNLFFTRDVGIVIGEHVVIGSMRHGARWSEELLIKSLFAFHPALQSAGIVYDGSAERRLTHALEGGDIHPLRPDLVLVGLSGRTTAAALDHLCELLFAHTVVTDVIVVVMPDEPIAIHLDMVFTQVDRGLCVVYPPHFIGAGRLGVLHRRKGSETVREAPDLFQALRAVDYPLEPIFCGGRRRDAQDREQWASGCNLVCVRPGVTIGYRRNEATLHELSGAGFRLVAADEVIRDAAAIRDGERAVIMLEGAELVRGGGGPRCMTLPIEREDA
jgi:arginine deiminase